MQIIKPAYYDAFRCLADQCPDSCCHEWEVQVDDESAQNYLNMEGSLGDRLRQVLYKDGDGYYLKNENSRCPMWREDGLCRIQAELGHDTLCKTCREFPRIRHDYGDFVELGLELSCPEAARLILSAPEQPPVMQLLSGGEAEYDPLDMQILQSTRRTMRQLLRNPEISVPEALAQGLIYGYKAQAALDRGEEAAFDPKQALAEAACFAKFCDGTELLEFFKRLEILTERWRSRLDHPQKYDGWPEELRAIACCLVDRYWLQAVADLDLVSRAKLVIISCLVIYLLGGDLVETAQLYSKEIENNIDNVDSILEGAYTCPAMTDEKLLGLLLQK